MAKSIAQEFVKGLWDEIPPFRLVLGRTAPGYHRMIAGYMSELIVLTREQTDGLLR